MIFIFVKMFSIFFVEIFLKIYICVCIYIYYQSSPGGQNKKSRHAMYQNFCYATHAETEETKRSLLHLTDNENSFADASIVRSKMEKDAINETLIAQKSLTPP